MFFVGVSRFAEGNLGPPPLEGYVSSDSVLHRLAAELYSIVYPALSNGDDESAGGTMREVLSDAVPSTSGSRQPPRADRSWKALSFLDRKSVV